VLPHQAAPTLAFESGVADLATYLAAAR